MILSDDCVELARRVATSVMGIGEEDIDLSPDGVELSIGNEFLISESKEDEGDGDGQGTKAVFEAFAFSESPGTFESPPECEELELDVWPSMVDALQAVVSEWGRRQVVLISQIHHEEIERAKDV